MVNTIIKSNSIFKPSVQLLNVSVKLNGKEVLKNISTTFDPGVHVVLGRNGAGKTTLLRAVAGLVNFSGEVRILGRSLKELKRKEASMLIGYCWQNPYYGFIEATVEDELKSILKILRVDGDWNVVELLVPKDLMERDPVTLSGGEAKKVSIASMLVADQPIWLLDEPFTYLDRDGVEAITKLVEYGRWKGKTIIVTLHEVYYASMINPDTFTILNSGSIVASSNWKLVSDEVLRRAGLVTRGEVCVSLCGC
jgi:energy-coupling factor transport system ATP-binding protein